MERKNNNSDFLLFTKIKFVEEFHPLQNSLIIYPITSREIEKDKIKSQTILDFFHKNFSVSIEQVSQFHKFKAKFLENFTTSFTHLKHPYYVCFLGLGEKNDDLNARCRELGLKIGKIIQSYSLKSVSMILRTSFLETPKQIFQLCLGIHLSFYQIPKISQEQSKKNDNHKVYMEFIGNGSIDQTKLESLTQSINRCRTLQDLAPNIATPSYISKEALKLAKNFGLKYSVYGFKKLKDLGFNAFLSVAKGSSEEPQFVILEYKPKSYTQTLALVGKGVTFDTGGYSLKVPSEVQDEMKYDMSGAAVVLNSITAIAKNQIPIRAYAVMPLCENMISGSAYKVSDIVTTYNQKTIEIMNTDAEGRVILADALAYTAEKLNPDFIITHATLTSAIIAALGHVGAGVFSFDDNLSRIIKKASCESGEKIHLFPIWEEIISEVKGDLSDLRNISKPHGPARSIYAAAFLKEFVQDIPFAHIDIAGVANGNKAIGYPKNYASGYGVQLNVEIARAISKK